MTERRIQVLDSQLTLEEANELSTWLRAEGGLIHRRIITEEMEAAKERACALGSQLPYDWHVAVREQNVGQIAAYKQINELPTMVRESLKSANGEK